MAIDKITYINSFSIPGVKVSTNPDETIQFRIVIDPKTRKQLIQTVFVDRNTGKVNERTISTDVVAERNFDKSNFKILENNIGNSLAVFPDKTAAIKELSEQLNKNSAVRSGISTRIKHEFSKVRVNYSDDRNPALLLANDSTLKNIVTQATANLRTANIPPQGGGNSDPQGGASDPPAGDPDPQGGASNPPAGDPDNPDDIPLESITAEQFNKMNIGFIKGYTPPGDPNNPFLYRYPIDIKGDQDYVEFSAIRYLPRNLSTQNNFTIDPRYDKRKIQQSLGRIILPIQPNASDTNSVNWQDQAMSAIDIGLAAISTSLQSGSNVTGIVEQMIKRIEEEGGELETSAKTAIRVMFMRLAADPSGDPNDFLSRMKGATINPNLELLFANPNLRNFLFNFTFTPRSELEAKEVIKIIRTFKEYSAVQRGVANLFLKAPHVFEIKYVATVTENGQPINHPGMNKIKVCALQGVSVDYTPAGTYATRTDGSMTSYELSLEFAELDPVYADDYKDNSVFNLDENVIGY